MLNSCRALKCGKMCIRDRVYATFFTSDPPARSAVQVGKLPKDAMVEIEAIAVR